MSASDTCPCCHAKRAKSATRCASCSAAIGEANRCARCLAYAAVIERTGGYVCGACSAPRERLPDTLCLSDAELLRALEPRPAERYRAIALLTALPWFAAAGLMRGVAPPFRWLFALVGALALVGLLARGQRAQRRTQRRRTFEIEQRIIGLAYQTDGVLREQDVSTRLRISLAEARAILQELADQQRAVAYGQGREVSEFRFGEARRTRAIRRRSQPPPTDSDQSS